MTKSTQHVSSCRTLLEQLIRERRQTFEEFAEFAEGFARQHDEPGTLSVRHLQRLVAGRQPGPPRPATARLLERIFATSITELLGSPNAGDAKVPEALRVAVAIVVRDQRVLLVRRRAGANEDLKWQFPAGMVKPGATVEDIAVSETLSETAVHCTPARRLGSRIHPLTRVICEYVVCEYITGEAANSDRDENSGVLWATYEELVRLIPVGRIYLPVLRALGIASPPQ